MTWFDQGVFDGDRFARRSGALAAIRGAARGNLRPLIRSLNTTSPPKFKTPIVRHLTELIVL